MPRSSTSSTAFLTSLERGLPISAIEQLDLVRLGIEVEIVETTNVYEVYLGERTRMAKGVDAAMFAKIMLPYFRIKPIKRQGIFTLQQPKLIRWRIAE